MRRYEEERQVLEENKKEKEDFKRWQIEKKEE